MATPNSTILARVRSQLIEATARFWTNSELYEHMRNGAVALWGAIIDLHQDHYLSIDENVLLRSGESQLTNVPVNCFRVQTIEPYDLTNCRSPIQFTPKAWKHPDFRAARAVGSQSASSGQTIYYQLSGVGAPIEAPRILIAPKLDADLRIRLAYNPSLVWDQGGNNPVPGESDNALFAYTVAFARAKETEPRTPDPSWFGIFEKEKAEILVRLTPRQEQEPEVVEDFFSGYQE